MLFKIWTRSPFYIYFQKFFRCIAGLLNAILSPDYHFQIGVERRNCKRLRSYNWTPLACPEFVQAPTFNKFE